MKAVQRLDKGWIELCENFVVRISVLFVMVVTRVAYRKLKMSRRLYRVWVEDKLNRNALTRIYAT